MESQSFTIKDARTQQDFWSNSNFVDEYCPRCGCILRYDEGDICSSCEDLKPKYPEPDGEPSY